MEKTLFAILALCATLAGCSKKPQVKSYSPLVPEGTIAIAVRDMAAMRSSPMHDFFSQWLKRQQDAAAAADNDDIEKPEAVRKLLTTINGAEYKGVLEKARSREKWSITTIGQLPFTIGSFDDEDEDAKLALPAIAAVTAPCKPTTTSESFALFQTLAAPYRTLLDDLIADNEGGAAAAEFLAKFKDVFEISTDTVAGCEVRKLTIKRTDDTAEFLDRISGLEPCFGVFDGSLEIFASSTHVFADTVALYSGEAKAAASDSLIAKDALLGSGAQARFGIYGISDILAKFAGDKLGEMTDNEVGKILGYARDFKIEESMDGEAMSVNLAIRASFEDETLAPIISSIVDGGLAIAKATVAIVAAQTKEFAPLVQMANRLSVRAQDGECLIEANIPRADFEAIDLATISKAAADRAGEFGMIKTSGGEEDGGIETFVHEEINTCDGDEGDEEDTSDEDGGDE